MAEATVADGTYEERSALYYPYIHIRRKNWLKAALLAFQKVKRIVPSLYTVADDEIIQPYSQLRGTDNRPLLDQADINTTRVRNAQESLFTRLKEHKADLVEHYSHERTPRKYLSGAETFQMHRMKILDGKFSDWLVDVNLAWDTRESKAYDVVQGNWRCESRTLRPSMRNPDSLSTAQREVLADQLWRIVFGDDEAAIAAAIRVPGAVVVDLKADEQ